MRQTDLIATRNRKLGEMITDGILKKKTYRSFEDQINSLVSFGNAIQVRTVVNGRVPGSDGADIFIVEVSDDGQGGKLSTVFFG